MEQNIRGLLAKIKAQIVVRKHVGDGGPGSGNWGHAGRPGKVGGSAERGGGKQYRGGRSDVGYFSSRKDWLNGLSGDDQIKATKILKAAKKEADEAGDTRSPEKVIMEDNPISDKKELMDLVGKARSWSERGFHLSLENLSEEEQGYMWKFMWEYATENKEGPKSITAEEWTQNDLDRVFDYLSPEEKNFYLDMKAKACGLPTSGKNVSEYSDELQYKIGTKERPVELPTGAQNGKYVDLLPQEESEKLIGILRANGVSYDRNDPYYDLNDAEAKLFNVNRSNMGAIREYLKEKDSAFGGRFFDLVKNGTKGLQGHQAVAIENITKIRDAFYPAVWSPGDQKVDWSEKESEFLDDPDINDEIKFRYLRFKCAVLGRSDWASTYDIDSLIDESVEDMRDTKEYKFAREHFSQNAAARKDMYRYHAKTSQDVAKQMKASGMFMRGAGAVFGSIQKDAAVEVALSYELVLKHFPFMVGKMGSLWPNEKGSDTYASCHMFGKNQAIHLNPSFEYFGNLDNMKESYEENVASGYHPKGTDYRSVVTHELAHAIDGYLTQNFVKGSKMIPSTQNFSGVVRRMTLRRLKTKLDNVGKELSEYATKNANEWFAEAISEALHSREPRPMAKCCYDITMEILREEGILNG